jgi:riboflavin kinase/FMN adenylyltransferase
MDRVEGVARLTRAHGRLFVVVGVFDGLHVGHAYLLRHLVAEARARSARPTVITFDAHPDAVLVGSAPPLLLDPIERAALLEAAGVDCLVVVHFDDALRRTPYDAFVRSIAERVDLAGFLMTPDAAFGHERRGTPETLAELGRTTEPGFDVVVVPPFELDGEQVRSSAIREQIGSGDLEGAARLLGRPYAVTGNVDASGAMSFELPVALPSVGSYPVAVVADGGEPRRARLTVGASPAPLLEPTQPTTGKARITFS